MRKREFVSRSEKRKEAKEGFRSGGGGGARRYYYRLQDMSLSVAFSCTHSSRTRAWQLVHNSFRARPGSSHLRSNRENKTNQNTPYIPKSHETTGEPLNQGKRFPSRRRRLKAELQPVRLQLLGGRRQGFGLRGRACAVLPEPHGGDSRRPHSRREPCRQGAGMPGGAVSFLVEALMLSLLVVVIKVL